MRESQEMIEGFIEAMVDAGRHVHQCPDCFAALWLEGTELDAEIMRLGETNQDDCDRCSRAIREGEKV